MKPVYIIIFLSLILTCCNNTGSSRTVPASKLSQGDTHFVIHHTEYDKPHAKQVIDTLEHYYSIITKHFSTGNIKTVHVHFYKDYADLSAAVKDMEPDLPSWAIGLATSATEIHMISPYQPGRNPLFMLKAVVHEFAHCVSLSINPRFGNNPRWLWEAVALYEAGQFHDPENMSFLSGGNIPRLAELNNISNKQVYELGYMLADFIVAKYGYDKLKELIQNNGDIKTSLDMNDEQFMNNWLAFVKSRY